MGGNSRTFFDSLEELADLFVAEGFAGGEYFFVLELHAFELVDPVLVELASRLQPLSVTGEYR